MKLSRGILENIASGVVTLDPGGRVTWVNPAAERFLGNAAAEAVGRDVREIVEAGTPLRQLLDDALDLRRFANDREFSHEPAGTAPRRLRVSSLELETETGARSIVVLLRDISEVHRLEQQVTRAEKFAALGTLSSAITHEIKNPLSALDLNLHLLAEELEAERPDQAQIRDYLAILQDEIRRLNSIVDHFLHFARPSRLQPVAVDLGAVLDDVLALVRPEMKRRGIRPSWSWPPARPAVSGDGDKLQQVFLNLVLNAIQAMPGGGELRVTAQAVSNDEPEAQRLETPRLAVTVTDTGAGMPPEVLSRIFDPYFTTREEGLGLGLALVYRIVEDHGGSIVADSRVGVGTSVMVTLPLVDRARSEEPA